MSELKIDMPELKFEVTIPAKLVERLIHLTLIKEFGLGLTVPGIKVNYQEKFVPSQGSESPNLKPGDDIEDNTNEYVWNQKEKEKPKDIADVIKEAMGELNKMHTEPHKEHWTKQLEKSLLTKLIAFKCDCGHITWRLCKDGDYSCECNRCNKVHKWDVVDLYRLDYSCKCGYKKYLYMPLSHQIKELKCGDCKAPIDITFNSKAKRFEQIK